MAKKTTVKPVAPVETVIPKIVFFCEKCGNILYKDLSCCKRDCTEMSYSAAKKKQELKKYDVVFVTPQTRKIVDIPQSVKVDADGKIVSSTVAKKVRAARKKAETVDTLSDDPAPVKKPRATRKKKDVTPVVGMVIPEIIVDKPAKKRASKKA